MRSLLSRALLLAVAGIYVAAASANYAGRWALGHPTPENLLWGIRWSPANPELWAAYGRYLLFSPDGMQPDKAVAPLLQAIAGNPLDARNWDALASAYRQLGESRKAEAALRAGKAAAPYSPDPAWVLANFLLLQGRAEEAFPYFRTAAHADRTLRPAVFDLGWKLLGDSGSVFRNVVPPDFQDRSDYLWFLISRQRLAGSYPVWQELRRNHEDVTDLGYAYVDHLATDGLDADAVKVWTEILQDTGRSAAKPEGEMLCNGDFESDLPNAGLDWRLSTGPGYTIALDNLAAQHGSRSLRVSFDGTLNVDFGAIWQRIPVQPDHDYQFRGYLKTENITSDTGLFFEVATVSSTPGEGFFLAGEERIGSNPWLLSQLTLHTGPTTHIVSVCLRRHVSRKLNNRLQGRVWMDNVSLQLRKR